MNVGTVRKISSWVHAEAPSTDEIELLCREYGLVERFVHDALDRDEIPRTETIGDRRYIITRFAFKKGESIRTAPVLFALGSHNLVTISLEKLPSFEEIMPDGTEDGNAKDPVLIMLRILLRINTAYDEFIHDSSKHIRHMLDRLGTREVGPASFIRLVHIEDDMNDFLSSLSPTNSTLKSLLGDMGDAAFTRHRDLVQTVILNNEQSIQTCDANLKAIVSIRRTYTLINGYSLDRTIRLLTLISVLIAIPTMFFSMYGMNVPLPWQHTQPAFIVIMTICTVIVLTVFALGRKRRLF